MNVVLSNALNGLYQQNRRIDSAAENIIKQTSQFEQIKETDPSLEESVVDLTLAKVGYKANAKVIKAQDDMFGTLMDILS